MCRYTERGGKRTREGDESGMGRLARMNRGSGIKDRDDRSTDAFAKINPTDPLRLTKQARAKDAKLIL
jgi:hypothetical protein